MAAKLFNLAQMISTTVGTGPVTLIAATSGYRTFVAAGVANGDLVSYSISNLGQHEFGVGVVTISGPITVMSRIMTGSTLGVLLPLDGSAIVTLTPRAEDLTTPTLTPGSWSVVTTGAAVSPAVSKTLYVIMGQVAPVPIALSTTAAIGDAVAVYMADFTSANIVTVDAGAAGAIGGYGQTHRIGAQYAFYVYRCVAPATWIVEWDPVLKPLRYRASNAQVGVLHGGSLLYMDSTGGARTITVPSNTTDPLPVGFQTELMRFGVNDVTIVLDVGVTIDTESPLVFPRIYSRGVLTKVNLNEWTWNLYGSTAPAQRVVTVSPDSPVYSDEFLFVNTAGACTFNFPSVASRNGRPLRVKDMAGITGHTINRNGTDVFEGGFTSFVFYTPYQGQSFIPTTIGGVATWAVM
jgi:hypothetical protein